MNTTQETSDAEFDQIIARTQENWDRELALKVLLDIKKVLDERGIPFFLAFGTALGAVRDGRLIPHDSDVDVGLLEEDRNLLLETITDGLFRKLGLNLCRVADNMVSLQRDEQVYADIYFFTRTPDRYQCGQYWIRFEQLDAPWLTVGLAGETFFVPYDVETYFTDRYGPEWRTPTAGQHANE